MKFVIINDIFRIMLKFNISRSTLYYLIKSKDKIYNEAIAKGNIFKDIYGLDENEMTWISKYITPPKTPLTIKNIQTMLNFELKSKARTKDISNFLKNTLKYSYKKGSSTSIKGASSKIHLQKRIFWWRMMKNVLMKKYIVNIDESSF